MNDYNEIRNQVSKDYAEAVTARRSGGGACCGSAPVQKGASVIVAGYSDADLDALPPEAAENSFGCGNPLAFSQVKAGQTVLDLGSGAGVDLLIAAAKVGPEGRVIGVDMTDEMIAKARENINAAGLRNVEVRKGIIEALPVDDASVDWVISNCVINLSPEKLRVFREIARVLKSGGTMVVSDIVAEKLPEEILQSPKMYSSCVAGAISEKDYIAGLEAAGLTNVRVLNRLVYDDAQLEAFVESELSGSTVSGGCCGAASTGGLVSKSLIASVSGKIWSAKIQAEKP